MSPVEPCPICVKRLSGRVPGSHCRRCHANWRGKTAAHCTKCHRTFSSKGAADRHARSYRDRDGELRRRCIDPATIDEFVVITRADGNAYWTPVSDTRSQGFSRELVLVAL